MCLEGLAVRSFLVDFDKFALYLCAIVCISMRHVRSGPIARCGAPCGMSALLHAAVQRSCGASASTCSRVALGTWGQQFSFLFRLQNFQVP